ncbi:hypothetical protein [Enterobacter hormaechei]|uniref:hypothetical protein n=1 Tax=Enterobacter hormaechei TaxID=158836 RepID=UPI000E0EA5B9|nr:hypothetical protein [Enterobacter hormaechei]
MEKKEAVLLFGKKSFVAVPDTQNLYGGCYYLYLEDAHKNELLIELNESDLYPGGAIELQHNGGRKDSLRDTKSKVESLTQVMFPKYVDRQT